MDNYHYISGMSIVQPINGRVILNLCIIKYDVWSTIWRSADHCWKVDTEPRMGELHFTLWS